LNEKGERGGPRQEMSNTCLTKEEVIFESRMKSVSKKTKEGFEKGKRGV
jgi:hypothetical protein